MFEMVPFAGVPADIIGLIRSTPTTPRQRAIPDKTLSEMRTAVEKHIKIPTSSGCRPPSA